MGKTEIDLMEIKARWRVGQPGFDDIVFLIDAVEALRERVGEVELNALVRSARCGKAMEGRAIAAEAEIERLRALVSWIETYDPQLVNAAEAKFPAPPSDGARPASRLDERV